MTTKSERDNKNMTRRDFIKTSAGAGAGMVLLSKSMVHAFGSDTIKVGLIGCGSRGTWAGIIDCAQSSPGVELVAMGDLFQDHMDKAPALIKENLTARQLPVDDIYKVTPETTFVGFDAYEKVLAAGVDMVILSTPPNFRPQHLRAAVEAGVHVFMEKPVAVDPLGVRSILQSADLAKEKGLTLVAGTQWRRLESARETIRRIHDGAIGNIVSGQSVRLGGGMLNWASDAKERRADWSDIEYYLRRWLFWTWLSGDFITEQHVHNLDVMNWAIGSHPLQCIGLGGRQVRTGAEFGNVYDHFAVEYLYANDVRVEYIGAQIDKISSRNDQQLQGSKGSVYLDSGNGIIRGANPYQYEGEQGSPAVRQYAEMIASIRNGEAINEGRQIAESTMTAILGRMSAYTGRALKWEWAMEASRLDLSPAEMAFAAMPPRPVAMPGVTELL